MDKKTIKRYLISSGVTFLATFLLVVATSLDTLNLETLTSGAVIGILVTAFRAGIKSLAEYLLVKIK